MYHYVRKENVQIKICSLKIIGKHYSFYKYVLLNSPYCLKYKSSLGTFHFEKVERLK